MKKLAVYVVFTTVLVIIAYQAVKLGLALHGLDKQYYSLKQQNSSLAANNSELQQEIQFYSDPHNLEKELRSKLNFILPGEKEIIIVPSTSTGQ